MNHLQRLSVLSLAAALSAPCFAADPYWYRNLQKARKSSSRSQTSVAAVRGVDEPGEVDSKARDYDAVKSMESRKTDSAQVDRFLKEGELNTAPAAEKSSLAPDVLKTAADALNLSPMSSQMKSAVRPISVEEEAEIGREVAANVAAQFGVFNDPALTGYVNAVGLSVARFCPRQDVPYRFAVLDSPILNAFAAPGGYIFITKGLLLSLKNEAELACVLGHEIAHVAKKHVINEIQKSRLVQASIPDYVKAEAKKAEWMSLISDAAVQSLWKGLSRKDELESDRFGIEWASAAGYDARTYSDVLTMLKEKSHQPQDQKQLKFLFSTHPKPEDRLQGADQALKKIPEGGRRLPERFSKNVKA
jgi:predicted Zn-dependent protease